MNENNYVVKANKFIEAKGRLGLTEQKLLACLISEIQPTDDDFKEYRLSIKELVEFANLDPNAVYSLLKDTAENLRSKTLFFEGIDPDTGQAQFIALGLITKARHIKGSGEMIVRIDPDLKPYLLAIKGHKTPFTKYMVKNILKLDSPHSIRVYELLKRYEGNWSKNKTFEVEEFKEKIGIEANTYERFYDFEKNVLKLAEEEINEKTDILIHYKKIKRGRKIAEIEFVVYPKDLDSTDEIHKELERTKAFNYKEIQENTGMADEMLSRKQIAELYEAACKVTDPVNGDPIEYMAMTYAVIKLRKPKSMFAYMKKALEQQFIRYEGKIGEGNGENSEEENSGNNKSEKDDKL